jgi:hypothetical protein
MLQLAGGHSMGLLRGFVAPLVTSIRMSSQPDHEAVGPIEEGDTADQVGTRTIWE